MVNDLSEEPHVVLMAMQWLKSMEILSGYKRKMQKFDVDRFDLKTPHDMEVKEQHQIHIRRRFAALINSDDAGGEGGFKIVCENVREKIQILV